MERASQILKGLRIEEQSYAPMPRYGRNGDYEYKFVVAYNSRYLVKDNRMNYKTEGEWDPFYPEDVWVEDRWLFVRRMFGDEFIGRIFYRFCDWIWKKNFGTDKASIEWHRNREAEVI